MFECLNVERRDMKKDRLLVVLAGVALCLKTVAATHTIPAGDVTALTNVLKGLDTWQTVKLSKGVYDLSSLSNAPMYKGWVGTSLLTCPIGTTITGETSNPEDVVLKGGGCYRILVVPGGCTVKNLTFTGGNANDKANSGYDYGGAFSTTGGTAPVCQNCIFTNNFARRYGGAVAYVVCTDCRFYNNQVTGNSGYGGAGYDGKYTRCHFSGNTAIGDGYACGGALYQATLVSDCTAVSNLASHKGGALYQCKNIVDSRFRYNAAATTANVNPRGGAISDCGPITNCVVEYNLASSYAHGICNGSAVGSTFRFNGNAHHGVDGSLVGRFEKCTFVGSSVRDAELYDCHVHSVSSRIHVSGNVYFGDTTANNTYAFIDVAVMRNSLVNDVWLTNAVNNALFYSNGAQSMLVENCTVVDNVYQHMLRYYNITNNSATFVNTAIVRNRTHNRAAIRDLSGYEARYVSLTNCIMGVTNLVQHSSCGFVDCKVLGENWNPAFIGDGDHPYSTKARSRLCSAGRILSWMTDDATDIAGNPRVRDGKVDVGCYQCWLDPLGFSLRVR